MPGFVLALAVHLDVFGAGLQSDRHGFLETPLNGQYTRSMLYKGQWDSVQY